MEEKQMTEGERSADSIYFERGDFGEDTERFHWPPSRYELMFGRVYECSEPIEDTWRELARIQDILRRHPEHWPDSETLEQPQELAIEELGEAREYLQKANGALMAGLAVLEKLKSMSVERERGLPGEDSQTDEGGVQ